MVAIYSDVIAQLRPLQEVRLVKVIRLFREVDQDILRGNLVLNTYDTLRSSGLPLLIYTLYLDHLERCILGILLVLLSVKHGHLRERRSSSLLETVLVFLGHELGSTGASRLISDDIWHRHMTSVMIPLSSDIGGILLLIVTRFVNIGLLVDLRKHVLMLVYDRSSHPIYPGGILLGRDLLCLGV